MMIIMFSRIMIIEINILENIDYKLKQCEHSNEGEPRDAKIYTKWILQISS